MKRGSENRNEAALRMNLLLPKTPMQIGMWNVKTMYDAGKTAQVVAETKLAVLRLCETRWTQSGQVCLPSYDLPFYEMSRESLTRRPRKTS